MAPIWLACVRVPFSSWWIADGGRRASRIRRLFCIRIGQPAICHLGEERRALRRYSGDRAMISGSPGSTNLWPWPIRMYLETCPLPWIWPRAVSFRPLRPTFARALACSHSNKRALALRPRRGIATIMLRARHAATLRSHPFGPRRAPRVGGSPRVVFAAVGRAIPPIAIAICAGEIHFSEHRATCESSVLVAKAAFRLLDSELDHRRAAHQPIPGYYLGRMFPLSGDFRASA